MKKILCCICSLVMVLCGCSNNTGKTPKATQGDVNEIEAVICKFAEGMITRDRDVLLSVTKENSDLYLMISERFEPEDTGDYLAEFQKEYEELGGDIKDFDDFKDFAKDISVAIDGNTAKADFVMLSLGGGASERSSNGEQTYIRTEKVAHKTEGGALEIKEENYISSDEGEVVGKGRYSTLSYGKASFGLEKIDGKWYIAELVLK